MKGLTYKVPLLVKVPVAVSLPLDGTFARCRRRHCLRLYKRVINLSPFLFYFLFLFFGARDAL